MVGFVYLTVAKLHSLSLSIYWNQVWDTHTHNILYIVPHPTVKCLCFTPSVYSLDFPGRGSLESSGLSPVWSVIAAISADASSHCASKEDAAALCKTSLSNFPLLFSPDTPNSTYSSAHTNTANDKSMTHGWTELWNTELNVLNVEAIKISRLSWYLKLLQQIEL